MSGSSEDLGGSSKDSRISLSIGITSSPLSRLFSRLSLGSLNSSQMSSGGLSNLRSQLRSNGGLRVECRGNKRLWAEGWCNTIIYRGNWETRVLNTESGAISNITDLLELASSINIRVSTSDSTISIANLLLSRVQVGISVVQVSKLILGMELD